MSVLIHVCTTCCSSRLAPYLVGPAATGIAVSCRTQCHGAPSCTRWALARSDGAKFRQMTKIVGRRRWARAMNPTCRRLMRYRTPCPMPCRCRVTDLRDPLGAPGLKSRHPSGKGCPSDKSSNRRCCERQTQRGGNGSAYARASAALTCAMPQCIADVTA
jgi:hypothetical protein